MKKATIERIIKQGSVRQKIKLYMTDIALFNISYNRDNALLTDKERDLIWNSIKDPKDVTYYENIRLYNKSFLMFKEHISNSYKRIYHLYTICHKNVVVRVLHDFYEEVINDIIEVAPDKKTRDLILKTAINKTKKYNGKKYQEKGFEPFLEINERAELSNLALNIEMLAEEVVGIKTLFEIIKRFLSKNLPIKPYKDYVNNYEKDIIDAVNKTIEIQEMLKEELPEESKKLIPYKDIEVDTTEEEIENIKNAGL